MKYTEVLLLKHRKGRADITSIPSRLFDSLLSKQKLYNVNLDWHSVDFLHILWADSIRLAKGKQILRLSDQHQLCHLSRLSVLRAEHLLACADAAPNDRHTLLHGNARDFPFLLKQTHH